METTQAQPKLCIALFSDCDEVAKNFAQIFDMQIGRLELSSKGEWVVYNPLAKAITNMIGRIRVEGIGMINAYLIDTGNSNFIIHWLQQYS